VLTFFAAFACPSPVEDTGAQDGCIHIPKQNWVCQNVYKIYFWGSVKTEFY